MGQVTIYTAVATGLPASVQPASTKVMEFYQQRKIAISHTIYVASPVDVRIDDTVSDGTTTYQVMGWRDMAGRNVLTALDVEVYKP